MLVAGSTWGAGLVAGAVLVVGAGAAVSWSLTGPELVGGDAGCGVPGDAAAAVDVRAGRGEFAREPGHRRAPHSRRPPPRSQP